MLGSRKPYLQKWHSFILSKRGIVALVVTATAIGGAAWVATGPSRAPAASSQSAAQTTGVTPTSDNGSPMSAPAPQPSARPTGPVTKPAPAAKPVAQKPNDSTSTTSNRSATRPVVPPVVPAPKPAAKPVVVRPAQPKPAAARPVQPKPAAARPVQPKPAAPKPAAPKPAAPQRGPLKPSAVQPAAPIGPIRSGPEAEVVRLVNLERSKAGCPGLRSDSNLATAARAHSADMAANSYFDHSSRDGRSFVDRIQAARYSGSPGGENIAAGASTPALVMAQWMASPGHKANILNCSFKAIGVGVATGGPYRTYWTQDFGR